MVRLRIRIILTDESNVKSRYRYTIGFKKNLIVIVLLSLFIVLTLFSKFEVSKQVVTNTIRETIFLIAINNHSLHQIKNIFF